jgi:competence protein ComEA
LLATLLVSILGAGPALANQTIDTAGHMPPTTQRPSGGVLVGQREATASVNINTADAKTLLELKGIGSKRAQTIISYREQNGPFKSVDDLAHVKGIGKKTVEQNYEKMTV